MGSVAQIANDEHLQLADYKQVSQYFEIVTFQVELQIRRLKLYKNAHVSFHGILICLLLCLACVNVTNILS